MTFTCPHTALVHTPRPLLKHGVGKETHHTTPTQQTPHNTRAHNTQPKGRPSVRDQPLVDKKINLKENEPKR